MEAMQNKQRNASALLETATSVDDAALARAFASVADAQRTAATIRLLVSLACLLTIVGLSIWIGRDVVHRLAALGAGFRRFGEGTFEPPIPVHARDELGEVAHQANQMASRLAAIDWLKDGHARVIEPLNGELEPEEVARRAVDALGKHLGASYAAIHYRDDGGRLVVLGQHGTPAAGTLVREPLIHADEVTGTLEVAVAESQAARAAELLRSVRENVTIAIEVARARVDLIDAERHLKQKAAELTRASQYKSQFLASMSHELRTPLNAIIGFSELLHEGMVPAGAPEQKEFLAYILSSARHLLQLINDILDLSKVEAGKFEFHPEPLRLTVLVQEVLGILRTTAAGRHVEVTAAIDDAVDELFLDASRLKQVLYNYLSNAIKFTPAGGKVAVRASIASHDRVRIEVEDTGVGIKPEHIDRLFVEFQQVGDDAAKAGGTGLGLALTKRLVEAQGGEVGVRSTPGVGSVFHAILPRAARAEPARKTTRASVVTLAQDIPAILVVEDDPEDQAALAAALGDAGYAVEVVSSGKQAVARARERSFDAITLDLLLPDMSGLDVLREIRADSENRDVPVVVITVVAEAGAVAGFAVSDVLPKPVDADGVRAALLRAGVAPSKSNVVMVVDDDESSLQLMSATLSALGYLARCESDAKVALETIRRARPHAIVLDLVMPGMSGFEFLDQLRSGAEGPEVPVIVWTSKDLTSKEHAVLRASANAVVSKGHGGAAGVVAELTAHLKGVA